MPKIINAYSDANGSIADSLKSLGESMFGNGASNEVHRQTAKGKQRENENIPLLAEAVRSGDRNALAYYGAMANKTGRDTADFNLLSSTNHAGGVDDNRVNLAQIGAHEGIGSTAVGQGRQLANATTNQKIASDRAAATQLAIAQREQQGRDDQFNRTPEKVQGPNGDIILQPRSQAMGMPSGQNVELKNSRDINDMTTRRQQDAERYKSDNTPTTVYDNNKPTIVAQSEAVKGHAGAPMTTDQMVATSPAFQQGLSGGAQPSADGASATPPGYIHPLVQKHLGYTPGAVPFQHMQSGAVGQSYDGGKTIDGHPAGQGWVPVTSQEGIGQTRTNAQIDAASNPLPAPPSQYPQAAQDAASTSGAKSLIQSEVNKTVGFLGGPQIGANTNAARQNLTNLANDARAVVLASPGRAAVQAQKWANTSIPQPGALGMTGANADQQRQAVVQFTQHLRSIYATEQQEAADRNTNPADRQKILSHMAELRRVIGAYEAPPTQQQPQAGAPQQAQPAPGGVLKYDAQGNRVQ